MSPSSIRRGVRVAVAIGGVCVAAYDGWSVQGGEADRAFVMRDLTLVLLAAGFWMVVETIVGAHEALTQMATARYKQLEERQASACAVAAQTVMEMRRRQEQAAVDAGDGKVTQLYS